MKTLIITLFFSLSFLCSFGQQGTYARKLKNGASCTIAIEVNKKNITSQVFAWWNSSSERTGTFIGNGILNGQKSSLTSTDDGDCKVKLSFSQNQLSAVFENCITSNLPEDFSGTYQKITNQVPGSYQITSTKAYFFRTPSIQHRLKAYLVKGNRVEVDIENMKDDKWVFVNYANENGKTTSGYLPWSVLK